MGPGWPANDDEHARKWRALWEPAGVVGPAACGHHMWYVDRDFVATGVAVYARVSSSDQRPDLDGQVARVVEFVTRKGWSVARTVTEVGSGLNGHRPKLMKVLADPSVAIVAVEHRDRRMRFGAEYVESALAAQGRRLVVVDPDETKDDLVQDMIEVLTSMCARLYGGRSARNRAEKALKAASEE